MTSTSLPDPPEIQLAQDFEEYLAHFPSDDAPALLDAFQRWREALQSLPTRDLPLKSLAAEYQLSHKEKLRLLFHVTLHYLHHTNDPIRALTSGCLRFIDRGDPIEEELGELARFIDFESACQFLLPVCDSEGVYYSLDGRLWREKLSGPAVVRDPALLKELQGRIRGGSDVNAFSTLASWVDSHNVSCLTELAELVRDKLGLPHLAETAVLEIRIPEAVVRCGGRKIQKPTFADSGGYPPFMPSRREDRYGYARDLSVDDLDTRGGPEVWHCPVEAPLASGLRYLGRPRTDLRSGMWKDYNASRSKV